MDLGLFNEFIEWIDTFNRWMMYLAINAKSIMHTRRPAGQWTFLCAE